MASDRAGLKPYHSAGRKGGSAGTEGRGESDPFAVLANLRVHAREREPGGGRGGRGGGRRGHRSLGRKAGDDLSQGRPYFGEGLLGNPGRGPGGRFAAG